MEKTYEKHQQDLLVAWGSGAIWEALVGRSNYNFLFDEESVEQFCDKVLEDFMTNYPPCQSTYIEDMIGKGHIQYADQKAIDQAKTTLKEMIKNQAIQI